MTRLVDSVGWSNPTLGISDLNFGYFRSLAAAYMLHHIPTDFRIVTFCHDARRLWYNSTIVTKCHDAEGYWIRYATT